jgi:hypothetical protein
LKTPAALLDIQAAPKHDHHHEWKRCSVNLMQLIYRSSSL